MAQLILRRIVQMVPLLVGISFLTFALINLIPGSPIQRYEFDPKARPEDIENIRHNLGLDKPWPLRYVYWVSDAAQGNLGYSLINAKPVTERILTKVPNTLLLTGMSLVIAIGL